MQKKFLALTILILFSTNCFSQFGRLFTTDNQLSNSLVKQIFQDQKGFIWIASQDGLTCFDSNKFTTYHKDSRLKGSLANNVVNCLFQDKGGRMFVGSANSLQTFDYSTNTFNSIIMKDRWGKNFACFIYSIIQRRNGDILIGTSGYGIFKMQKNDNVALSIKMPGGMYIRCLYEDHNGTLWIVSENMGIFAIRGNHIDKFMTSSPARINLSCICEDKRGNLFVGSLGNGLFWYNKKTNDFVHVASSKSLPIVALLASKNDKIFLGTDGYGMITYNPKDGKISTNKFYSNEVDLNKAKVHSIIEDRNDNLWLGIFQKGIFFQPGKSNGFEYIGSKSGEKNYIGYNCIMSVNKDRKGTLWVGTDNDGLYGITLDGKKKIHLTPDGSENSTPPTILCICEDWKQNLWVGSYLNGCGMINKTTGYYEQLPFTKGAGKHVFDMTIDNNNNLWIGTIGDGLKSYNLNTRRLTEYRTKISGMDVSKVNRINNNCINALRLSKDKRRLFISTPEGLGCLDLTNHSFVNTFGANCILRGEAINYTFEDGKDFIYAGGADGLFRINLRTLKIKHYTIKDGLPNDAINSIESDNNGNLWISTNNGLSYMDIKKETFINYYSSNGLQGNEFSCRTSYSNGKNFIIFGGTNGLTYFNPNNIRNKNKKLHVYLNNFFVNEQKVTKGLKSNGYEIVDTSVIDAKKFDLSYLDNSFTLNLSAMEYDNPERITYLYSINGDDWIKLGNGVNDVNFSHLSPGTYKFRIKANDYNSESDIHEFTVVIHPAWYMSFWAYLVYFIVILYIVYLLYQHRKRKVQNQLRLQEYIHAEQLDEAKIQFFMNISHEIRTPMTLIVSPLQKLINTDMDETRQKTYLLIRRNAERILHLINQLMDIRKIDKGQMNLHFRETDIVSFINDIYSLFEYQAKDKNIIFNFTHDCNSLNVWVDMMNFDKVIVNVLSNAFKFTPNGGSVTIDLVHDSKIFSIIVSDNGSTIDEDKLEQIFERFYQISNNSSYIGTGIGLHLTRSLVELHHGTIKAKNNENGKGCRFIINLPLGKDHLKPEEIENSDITGEDRFENLILEDTGKPSEYAHSKNKQNIVIAEDDDEIRKYVCDELSTAYHITECSNGKEALTEIFKKAPDIVISDIMMPEMDGNTLCSKIKGNININDIPVILLTAKDGDSDKMKGLSIGADAYIVKPFNIDVLRKTIENLIHNREVLRNKYSGNELQNDKVECIKLKSPDEKLLERVMSVINKNLSNPDLSVEFIANEVGISRVHLHRKMKELTNQTTRDFVRNIRLEQAANLMANGHHNITEVMYTCGFANASSFSTLFKSFYGLSPKDYMNEHGNKQ